MTARAGSLEDERRAYVNAHVREQLAQMSSPARAGLCLVGSSIMSQWPEQKLRSGFAAFQPVVNYGVPGCQALDMPNWAWAHLGPTQPRVVLFYAGSNDLANGARENEVADRVRAWFRVASAAAPAARVVVCGVILCPSKLAIAGRTGRTNELLREVAQAAGAAFVDPNGVDGFAASDGSLRGELFVEDGLHLTESGYDVLAKLLTPHITAAWGALQS